MCGIFASNDPRVTSSHYDVINSRLSFRGPDFSSELIEFGGWKLYHSRLAIIAPTEHFTQPFRTNSGGMLIFNGEIFNFKDLISKYGCTDTNSDTEALASLLEIEDFELTELDGFFAFVYIDATGSLRRCARDFFGVKPLYVHRNGEFITISSEASVLSDLFDLSYNTAAQVEFQIFRAPIFTGSYFNEVTEVPPGACLIDGSYFDLIAEFKAARLEVTPSNAELGIKIKESINSRLLSDVPVGLLYSGGIDSNLIYDVVDREIPRLTGGFEGDYDIDFAKNADDNNLNQNAKFIIAVTDAQFRERFTEMVKLRKEPLSVPNEVILSLIGDVWATEGGKVLLSGEAADEFFAGYDRIYSWAAFAEKFNLDQFLELYSYCPAAEIPAETRAVVNEFFTKINFLTPFEQVRYFFIKKHLPILFRRLDFALMFSGVEGREPLATLSMLRSALRFRAEDLINKKIGKLPLRSMAARNISQEFAFAEKVGFPVDLGKIFRNKPVKQRKENYRIWFEETKELLGWS